MIAAIDDDRLSARLRTLGDIGRDGEGHLSRPALSEADRGARDLFVSWLQDAGLEVIVDRIGNIFGRTPGTDTNAAPVLIGSHLDTVRNAGIYDGPYGVVAGLGVIEALKAAAETLRRPVMVAAFTNEEGARYTPDMMGSLVYAGGLATEAALMTVGVDGSVLGEELARIGYAGAAEPGFVIPHAFVELHIEQGPVLEREGIEIGAVENLQGISWQRVTVEGKANHAGTTPMSMRIDAGRTAARIIASIGDHAERAAPGGVATVGTIAFEPNVINVIPSKAIFTVDLRHPDELELQAAEDTLAKMLMDLGREVGANISVERLARFEPVKFDGRLCELIEEAAQSRRLSVKRMSSGAGHDAQMMARICPSAMIFVPSRDGVSHNPREYTEPRQLLAGAEVLLDVVTHLASA